MPIPEDKEVSAMPRFEMKTEQIEQLINQLISQLPERERIRLVRKLEARTLPARWRIFLRQIDQRRGKYPVSEREMDRLVEVARQEVYERNRH